MPHKLYRFEEYEAWFEMEREKLTLEPGTSVCGPECDPLGPYPFGPPWRTDYAIIFPDAKYLRVSETYGETKAIHNGAGRRNHFSFHYGKFSGELDSDGYPEFTSQVDLRIDKESSGKYPPHIHYAGEDHIPHTRTPGLDFEMITLFEFIAAVLKHRKTGESLPELLGFKVNP